MQGERWGKGLAAATGCEIHPHIYSQSQCQHNPQQKLPSIVLLFSVMVRILWVP